MTQLKTDGGSQFTAKVAELTMQFLKIVHNTILPYHPEANGIVERRNAEVLKHLLMIDQSVLIQLGLSLAIIYQLVLVWFFNHVRLFPLS